MFRGNDLIRIYNNDYEKIGVATRDEIHHQGLLHQVAHIWMFQHGPADEISILFQQRSFDRELYAGKYDLLQTTHIDPDETFEESIVNSMDYYLGVTLNEDCISHIGTTRQIIDQGDYHDNALVQVYVCKLHKAIFVMPEVEQIVKTHYQEMLAFIHGETDALPIYSLDDALIRTTNRSDWWLRSKEFIDVVEPYIQANGKYLEEV